MLDLGSGVVGGARGWVAGRAGLWGVPQTWVWVVGVSPQILEHPTSICDTGVNQVFPLMFLQYDGAGWWLGLGPAPMVTRETSLLCLILAQAHLMAMSLNTQYTVLPVHCDWPVAEAGFWLGGLVAG